MGAIADLWKSERGLLASLLIIGATVLAALGEMAVEDWREFSLSVFGIYATAKTVTGGLQIMKGGTADPETRAPTPAPVPVPTPLTGQV